jgi:hypothetical protein
MAGAGVRAALLSSVEHFSVVINKIARQKHTQTQKKKLHWSQH